MNTINDESNSDHENKTHLKSISFPYLNMNPDRPNPIYTTSIQMDKRSYCSSKDIIFSTDGLTVKCNKDYNITLANYGISEGTYYFEVRILDLPEDSNIRLGIAQVSTPKDVPLGYDGFSYSYRANPGTLFHRSRPFDVNKGYCEGDVVGVLIHLPQLNEIERKEIEFRVLDQAIGARQYSYEINPQLSSKINPIKVQCGENESELATPIPFPEQFDYNFQDPFLKFDQLPIHSGSQLCFFVNGELIDHSFLNLYLAKYHPAISIYNGAKVKLNFGPQFVHSPPEIFHPKQCPNVNKLDLIKYGFKLKESKVNSLYSLVENL
ncbi:hypothetical protein K502DRAFT_344487 [Neoconidiobolus thromboides FSU 785]|nr:hypothetical protein K502DRAFT_344487 [Neoconidiobolus thromboides FSU 785]